MIDLIKAKRVEAKALAAATPTAKEEIPTSNQPKNPSGWFARLMLKYYLVACVASYVFVALVSGEWGIRPEFVFANSIAAPVLVLFVGAVEVVLADEEHLSGCLLIAAAAELGLGVAVSALQFFMPSVPELWIGAQLGFVFGALMAGWWLIKKLFW